MPPARYHSGVPAGLLLRLTSLSALFFSAASAVVYYTPLPSFCAPGGGCDAVRHSHVGDAIGPYLPALGLLTYTLTFVGSLTRRKLTHKIVSVIAFAGGLGAAVFIVLQGLVIQSWCWLCIGADASALLAGLAAIPLLRSRAPVDGRIELRSPWWAPWLIATLGPLAWTLAMPEPDVPEAIRELYHPDVVDVVEVADFGCPHCRAMHPSLRRALRGERNVRLSRVIVAMHPSRRLAMAGYHCAVDQRQGEAMADRLFASEDFERATIVAIAGDLGMNAQAFEACLDGPSAEAQIEADEARATRAGISGVPMVYIEGQTLLGFRETDGSAPYLEAIAAARTNPGRRIHWWPLGGLALAVVAVFVWGRRR